MISVGIFNGYFPYTLEESIKRIKALGFTSVQLDLCFKDLIPSHVLIEIEEDDDLSIASDF